MFFFLFSQQTLSIWRYEVCSQNNRTFFLIFIIHPVDYWSSFPSKHSPLVFTHFSQRCYHFREEVGRSWGNSHNSIEIEKKNITVTLLFGSGDLLPSHCDDWTSISSHYDLLHECFVIAGCSKSCKHFSDNHMTRRFAGEYFEEDKNQ